MKSRLILRGNVPAAIRSDRDMCVVDPKAADGSGCSGIYDYASGAHQY
ncbi:MAG: hypothetical protein IKI77_10325 [Oscillospiraceae bacterium]|nr:hypothetical protein [Oscillospiraceae bacterium]